MFNAALTKINVFNQNSASFYWKQDNSDGNNIAEKISHDQEPDGSLPADGSCNKDNRFSLEIDDIEKLLGDEDSSDQTEDNVNYRLYAISVSIILPNQFVLWFKLIKYVGQSILA